MVTFKDICRIHKPKPSRKIIKEIALRFSPRHFSDDKIPVGDLETIFEAARWTPSGRNNQPWYFYFAVKGTESYQKLFSSLNEFNQSWAGTAPVLILACAIVENEKGGNPFALYDLGAAVISLILQAQSLGYYSRQMGLFDKEIVRKTFKLEKGREPFTIIALGKAGNYKNASREIIDLELSPRPRKTEVFKKL